MPKAASVAIVGLGPWGLCVLERLLDAARSEPYCELVVHVVEPSPPGGGIFSEDQPDYFVLNTPCGQHNLYPFPEEIDESRAGKGFFEWVSERGYRWYGSQCKPAGTAGNAEGPGRPVGPGDFLPRRLMGEYLEWFYEALCGEAPANVRVLHHKTTAEDVVRNGAGETVWLADGHCLSVDHVVLTTGHGRGMARSGAGAGPVLDAYPVGTYLASTRPGERVAVEGMGLVAFDVLAALTTGLGGRFSEAGGGRLRYHPSGREPQIYLFSRGGFPYCAKSPGTADPVGAYRPAIFTPEAVRGLQGGRDGSPRYQLDARSELLPLIFAEMELAYYTAAALLRGGRPEAERVRAQLQAAWREGAFGRQVEELAPIYGRFSAAQHFFVGVGRHYADSASYQSQVYRAVAEDLDQALVPAGASPVKTALETLRALRDTLRQAVEWKGLTLASHLDFTTNLQSRFARLVAGPPAFRCQELLALMDAGVVRVPFGPAPLVEACADRKLLVRSRHLEQPFGLVVDKLVRAHLDLPSVERPASALVARLATRGRLRPLMFGETAAGSIDLTEDSHPIGTDGKVQERLWVFGVLTEGARYFTLYVPSPKSRARAFLDAGAFARSVLSRAGPAWAARGRIVPAGCQVPVQVGRGRTMTSPRQLRVALVNNMADRAFAETENAFMDLLGAGSGRALFGLFTLPGIQRGPEVRWRLEEAYLPIGELAGWEPDIVVLTGTEPKSPELTGELFWPALESVLGWAQSSVPVMAVSCLAAHAALWAYDRLPRRLMAEKLSGAYSQELDASHPLMAGIGELCLPHSRFNEVPEDALVGAGYRVLARSQAAGWTLASGQRGCCELLLLQGHPEYTPLTLLREYRRDVRRYLSGTQGYYPKVPAGYLDEAGTEALEAFAERARRPGTGLEAMALFPFEVVSEHIVADWSVPAEKIFANWVRHAGEVVGKEVALVPAPALARPGVAAGLQ